MAFSTPTFNLMCNVWRNGNLTTNPPDVTSSCNLAMGRRGKLYGDGGTGLLSRETAMYLLLPALTDVRSMQENNAADTVECPAGTGRFYAVVSVDDSGKGFSNEHRVAILAAIPPWPMPIP